MTIRELYEECGGDFDEVKARLLSEDRVERFLLKILDNKDYEGIVEALNNNKPEDAFRCSHNLKGICLTLGLTEYQKSSSNFCEIFRNGMPSEDYTDAFNKMTSDRQRVLDAIKKYKESKE